MSEETLKMGLRWFSSIRESEAATAYAGNPDELVRTLECLMPCSLTYSTGNGGLV